MLRVDLMPACHLRHDRRKRFRDDPPLSALLHRRRRPTPLRISTRPRGAKASTISSTIYANRCLQQVRIFRTMPLAARWGNDTAYAQVKRANPQPSPDAYISLALSACSPVGHSTSLGSLRTQDRLADSAREDRYLPSALSIASIIGTLKFFSS